MSRRASVAGLISAKAQRTSKTTHKLVELPSAPQTRPLLADREEDLTLGHEIDGEQGPRKEAGFKRLTAYCVAESFKMKLLSSFLKREHNVSPRAFDEHCYGPNANVRSSAPSKMKTGRSFLAHLSEPKRTATKGPTSPRRRRRRQPRRRAPPFPTPSRPPLPSEASKRSDDDVAEVVFFEYGVVVFFGLAEDQERDILEDIDNAGIMKRKMEEEDWEIEECHFTHDPLIAYPRIYNDFFSAPEITLAPLKLSIAHALAQSTSSHDTKPTPAPGVSGALKLRRHEALKLTGRLFKLRRDVNLVSNVLDVPELFWSEASLKELYDAVLNDKLGVASDFLDAIHDHLNSNAMDRITWIVIWLIVVACLVELGEV
ncbi:hypothetical protein BJ912DRAFT_1022218 [Pholiota molesta]|nr:hypothetical protein BJ912DRAFT_1022218 [Pholiota molesta]